MFVFKKLFVLGNHIRAWIRLIQADSGTGNVLETHLYMYNDGYVCRRLQSRELLQWIVWPCWKFGTTMQQQA